MSEKEPFTLKQLREVWKSEFLPSIRREIKSEIDTIKAAIDVLTKRCDEIESSQQLVSEKYDETQAKNNEILDKLKSNKKEVSSLRTDVKGQQDKIDKLESINRQQEAAMDELQQYIRRDCLEITGITQTSTENPKQLVLEVASIIGANIKEDHISTVHRLPDSRKVKDRLIVKFTHRDKRDEMYSNKSKLNGKTTKNLPSLSQAWSPNSGSKIHINESLTSYRKRLFGRIHAFKKKHSFKFLWTVNGKIMLRQSESTRSSGFVTQEEFDEFVVNSGLSEST